MSFGIQSHSIPTDAVVSLPGGKTLTMKELEDLDIGNFGFEDPHEFLGRPELALENPTPINEKTGEGHYGWPLKNNKTAAHVRQNHYRVVRPEELKEDCKYPIATQGGAGDGQVEWENHILVEIEPKYYKRFYRDTAWRSTIQLAQRALARMKADAAAAGLPITPTLNVQSVKGI